MLKKSLPYCFKCFKVEYFDRFCSAELNSTIKSLTTKTLIEINYFFITQIITAIVVHSMTNFIMCINSVYAVSIENM